MGEAGAARGYRLQMMRLSGLVALATLVAVACGTGGYDGPVASFERGGAKFDYPAGWELVDVTPKGENPTSDCDDGYWSAGLDPGVEARVGVGFCPGSFGAPATSQEQVAEGMRSEFALGRDEMDWDIRNLSDEELDDLYGVVGVVDGFEGDGFPEEGTAHARYYWGVVPGTDDYNDSYSVFCAWPEGDPDGIEHGCELIADTLDVA